MPTTYKILGYLQTGTSGFFTDFYEVPLGKTAVVSSLVISNPTAETASIGVDLVYNEYNTLLFPDNATLASASRLGVTEGWTLPEGARIRVLADGCHYTLFGSEIS